jgi:hypothetical protein
MASFGSGVTPWALRCLGAGSASPAPRHQPFPSRHPGSPHARSLQTCFIHVGPGRGALLVHRWFFRRPRLRARKPSRAAVFRLLDHGEAAIERPVPAVAVLAGLGQASAVGAVEAGRCRNDDLVGGLEQDRLVQRGGPDPGQGVRVAGVNDKVVVAARQAPEVRTAPRSRGCLGRSCSKAGIDIS